MVQQVPTCRRLRYFGPISECGTETVFATVNSFPFVTLRAVVLYLKKSLSLSTRRVNQLTNHTQQLLSQATSTIVYTSCVLQHMNHRQIHFCFRPLPIIVKLPF